MINYKNTVIPVTLLSIIIIAAWMTISYQPKRHQPTDNNLPDAIMENVTTTIMDAEGKPRLKIVTPRMHYYAKNDTTNLIKPRLTVYRNTPNPWYISAKFATATQGIDNIHFTDDVVVQHPPDKETPMTTIKTAKLMVHPRLETVETEDPITLIQPNIVVNAIGMQADMKEGNIKLLSEAKAEYVPN